ncbi:YjgB family protein [Shimazuella sp. AN120528]|uniref:DUF4309 domain-containing protein n=1 Tax=Shimazuella soli TaxID=1892854 RepID=UPI001F0DBF52|nr:DUF4309 domain-containing protein [Shimazuella soli]MCH5585607.1 YjgB family protein [Shimazuella soli]
MLRQGKLAILVVLSFVLTFYTFGVAQAAQSSVLKKTKEAAQNGHIINSEFGINSDKGKIKKKYGKPDQEDQAMLNYLHSRQVAFGLDKNKSTTLYSVAKEYKGITSDKVEKELGKPNCVEGAMGKAYWSYHLGKYLLTFQFQNGEVKTLQQVIVEKNRTCNEIR